MYYKPEIKTAETDGISMDYFVFGEGKKIFVMLPGLSLKKITDSAASVASAYRNFGEDYTVYVFDRKNNVEAGYYIEDMAADTAKIMAHLGIRDTYLFGVSQGGMIAQVLASEHPELVKKLILGSTSAKENTDAAKVFVRWIICALKGETRSLVESFLDSIYSDEFLKKYRDALVNMFSFATSDELIRFSLLAAACRGFDATEKIKKISCPALVIGAGKDKIFGVEHTEFLSEALGAEMYIYKDYGHAVYDEAPDYKDRIREFFDKDE